MLFIVAMPTTELPLYPKLSSIYNKIMQLAIAIVLIIVVMNIWISSDQQSKLVINEHFNAIGQDYITQASAAVSQLITEQENNSHYSRQLKHYLQSLVAAKAINSVSFYDETGQLIINIHNDPSINELYAVNTKKQRNTEQLVPFVSELRHLKQVNNGVAQLQGYLRLTMNKAVVTQVLTQAERDKSQLERLMLIMAGFIGFLLTRGLNRFSRQGYRLAR